MELNLPDDSTIYRRIERDSDKRGSIVSIVDPPIQNVSLIESNPGSHRSNHYHHKDFHFMYVLEGEIDYFFKPLDSENVSYFKVKQGETILSPPKEIHSCYFPVSTLLIVSSGFPRDQKTYEADTQRVEFINDSNVKDMIRKYGFN